MLNKTELEFMLNLHTQDVYCKDLLDKLDTVTTSDQVQVIESQFYAHLLVETLFEELLTEFRQESTPANRKLELAQELEKKLVALREFDDRAGDTEVDLSQIREAIDAACRP